MWGDICSAQALLTVITDTAVLCPTSPTTLESIREAHSWTISFLTLVDLPSPPPQCWWDWQSEPLVRTALHMEKYIFKGCKNDRSLPGRSTCFVNTGDLSLGKVKET